MYKATVTALVLFVYTSQNDQTILKCMPETDVT